MAGNKWRNVNGVLLLDKAVGVSSNDALQKVRRLFRARKAGHAGTLDPLATGLLLCAFGQATKFIHDLIDADKTYRAQVRLGWISSTGDGEGELSEQDPDAVVAGLTDNDINQAAVSLTGDIEQLPPLYSAVKHKGKPLYVYARRGQQIDREARVVTIHALSVLEMALPDVTLQVHCSKGTYIRVLAEDFGRALGCGAYLAGLRRESVAGFTLEQAWTLEKLVALDAESEDLTAALLPVDSLVQTLPAMRIDAQQAQRFAQGQAVTPADPLPDEPTASCRVYRQDQFLGVALVKDGLLAPKRLIVH